MPTSDETPDRSARMICVGTFLGPHGLDGIVKIRSYTGHPEDIASYGPVSDESGGRQFDVCILRSTTKGLVAELSGIEDRSAAEAIKGLKLYVTRSALPELVEGEFYFSDLIGLDAVTMDGLLVGKVKAMDNYGAGDLMEVELQNGEALILPFSHDVVPVVDIPGARVVVDPPHDIYGNRSSDRGKRE